MSRTSSTPFPSSSNEPLTASNWWVIVACAAIMVTEGFDLLIFSNAIPSLLTDASLGIDKVAVGSIGSMIFVGMLLGGLVAGKATQTLGLMRTAMLGFACFTVTTALIGLAQTGWQIGLLRFLAGLGLGVVLPAGLSLARKHVQQRHGALAISVVMSGIPVGGMLAAVVSHATIPSWGWRPLFAAAGVLGLLVMALIGPYLARIEQRDRLAAAHQDHATVTDPLSGQPLDWRAILRGASLPVLALGTLATLADLLTWYGVSVWLTQLMREFEVPFSGAMQLMFTLNIGAVAGSLLTASLAMRWGTRPVAMLAGVVASLCLLLIASRWLSSTAMLPVIALLGMSAISAQNLVNALVADAFPVQYRAAAIGITLGLGRLGAVIAPALGGYILAAGHGPSWVLVVFAVSAVAGVLLLLGFTPRRSAASVAYLNDQVRHSHRIR